MIEALSGRGRSADQIAKLLKITKRDIRQTYRQEMELGELKALAKLEQTAHELANGRPAVFEKLTNGRSGKLIQTEIKPREGMVKFLLLTKGGYRMPANTPPELGGISPTAMGDGAEKNEVVITIKGGLPPRVVDETPKPPAEAATLAAMLNDDEGDESK